MIIIMRRKSACLQFSVPMFGDGVLPVINKNNIINSKLANHNICYTVNKTFADDSSILNKAFLNKPCIDNDE